MTEPSHFRGVGKQELYNRPVCHCLSGDDQSGLFEFPIKIILLVVLFCQSGCRVWVQEPLQQQTTAPQVHAGEPLNPLPVPMLARELVMDEISDEIDNYFPILKEERIRLSDGILSEGWIETRPTIGGSILEPWKKDSTPGFEKMHSTLQTIRRFAKVRVIPTDRSYLVDLQVYKELEDLPQPLGATVSGQAVRIDNSLDVDRFDIFDVRNKGWIPLGRDFSLEQEILRNLETRFFDIVRSTNGPPPNSIPEQEGAVPVPTLNDQHQNQGF